MYKKCKSKDENVITKSIKVTLKECITSDTKEMKNIIKSLQSASCKACNKASTMYYLHYIDENEYDPVNYYNEKVIYRKTYECVVEDKLKQILDFLNTNNVSQTNIHVQSDFKRLKKEISNNEASLMTYKLKTPIYISGKNYLLLRNIDDKATEKCKLKRKYKDGYFVKTSLFSKEGKKQFNLDIPIFKLDKLDNNKKSIINKIIDGKYKKCSCQLRVTDKEKIELIITFSFVKNNKIELNKNRILGIDLGIVNLASMAIWDNNKQNWDYIRYSHNLISGQEAIALRQKYYNLGLRNKELSNQVNKNIRQMEEKEYRKLSTNIISGYSLMNLRKNVENKRIEFRRAAKWCGDGKIGHGKRKRYSQATKIGDEIARFKDTFNHKYSRYIVDFAVKNNCGIIQLENLKNFDTSDKFLKQWTYYDLQTKIEYKAKEYGIEVIKINPQYTSKRCSNCGNINYANRDCKNNQSKFKCVNCSHEENADINAAKNIAIPCIDEIIKQYLKESKVN